MRAIILSIFFSFPVRLLMYHLRGNLLLIGVWLFLLALITGKIGRKLGFQYLFLDPEYLGKVGFWSFFLLGLAFGGFCMTWNLTAYLISAHRFPFLATLSRPFTKFCLNNLIIPAVFFLLYLGQIIYFQALFESWQPRVIFIRCLGLCSGAGASVVLYFLYFYFTNRDIFYYQHLFEKENDGRGIMPGRRSVDLDHIKLDASRYRVDTYLTEKLQPRLVRSVAHYDAGLLMRIFKQHHLNALVLILWAMVILVGLSALIDYPHFRIPAGASLLIMLSVFTAVIGAVTYWFGEWKTTVLILFLVGINYFTSFDIFSHRNAAYGMDYEAPHAPYSYPRLKTVLESGQVQADKANTITILEKWRDNTRQGNQKPKLVVICASGGGLKSATWTMKVLQEADQLTQGRLLEQTVLITGASGGMIGMAYARELYLRRKMGETIDFHDPRYLDIISRDLLNSVAFTMVSNDLFLPWAKFQAGGYTYRKDRGYTFERQLNENTGQILDKTLADYRRPEQEALIPMLYITPSIINDARRLIISPQGVSFMMAAPVAFQRPSAVEIDAVDFRWLFQRQNADNLRFLSALRMNATYPYVLPSVFLPSSPAIEALDAGFRDNYGILSATRFIQVFRDWILENTSGVILLQITSSDRIESITPSDNKGIIESLFNPLGIPRQLISLQEFEQDNSLGFLYDLLGPDQLHLVRFLFRPERDDELLAGISFHITEREKRFVLGAIQEPDNQASLRQLIDLLEQDGNTANLAR
jgi:hypothetical protein